LIVQKELFAAYPDIDDKTLRGIVAKLEKEGKVKRERNQEQHRRIEYSDKHAQVLKGAFDLHMEARAGRETKGSGTKKTPGKGGEKTPKVETEPGREEKKTDTGTAQELPTREEGGAGAGTLLDLLRRRGTEVAGPKDTTKETKEGDGGEEVAAWYKNQWLWLLLIAVVLIGAVFLIAHRGQRQPTARRPKERLAGGRPGKIDLSQSDAEILKMVDALP